MNYIHQFVDKMKSENLVNQVIETFIQYYQNYVNGDKGLLSREEIEPPEEQDVINYNDLSEYTPNLLSELAVCKLNGGLGTSMGLTKAKSLLPVFQTENGTDLTFLDVILKQLESIHKQYDVETTFLLMNSYNTDKDTKEAIDVYDWLKHQSLEVCFLQNKYPRIRKDDNSPLQLDDEDSNWNPPGHGDIYTALSSNGILDKLIAEGKEYLFISNSDNLGATPDVKILTYLKNNDIPFLMEVCKRTDMDKKGGHLARSKSGNLLLREVAQCPDNEIEEFQNIDLYSFFNTNSLWVNLKKLKSYLSDNGDRMTLPLIVNPKNVNGVDVIQLETAMGAAISVFKGAKALEVPRSRFIPVKKTNELLLLWSKVYLLNDRYEVILNSNRTSVPQIHLDQRFYKTVDDLKEKLWKHKPDFRRCRSLQIDGNVWFGDNVVIIGDVSVNGCDKKYEINNRILEGLVFCHPEL